MGQRRRRLSKVSLNAFKLLCCCLIKKKMRVNRFSSLSSGFSDSSRGNKEAQQTMLATCSPSWTRISPPPPSPASSPKWWSGETPPTPEWQRPFWNLASFFARTRRCPSFCVSCRFVSVSLLSFFLSALLVCLFWRGRSLYLKDFECRSRVELEDVRCGAVNVTNMEAVEGRKFTHRVRLC